MVFPRFRNVIDEWRSPLARIGGTLLVHAEVPGPLDTARHTGSRVQTTGGTPRTLASRPNAAEDDAIALLIRSCAEYGVRTHIVHLSSSTSVAPLADARAAGLPVSVETCPHYLVFAAEEVPDGATE